jgi:hypothetical protein
MLELDDPVEYAAKFEEKIRSIVRDEISQWSKKNNIPTMERKLGPNKSPLNHVSDLEKKAFEDFCNQDGSISAKIDPNDKTIRIGYFTEDGKLWRNPLPITKTRVVVKKRGNDFMVMQGDGNEEHTKMVMELFNE